MFTLNTCIVAFAILAVNSYYGFADIRGEASWVNLENALCAATKNKGADSLRNQPRFFLVAAENQ